MLRFLSLRLGASWFFGTPLGANLWAGSAPNKCPREKPRRGSIAKRGFFGISCFSRFPFPRPRNKKLFPSKEMTQVVGRCRAALHQSTGIPTRNQEKQPQQRQCPKPQHASFHCFLPECEISIVSSCQIQTFLSLHASVSPEMAALVQPRGAAYCCSLSCPPQIPHQRHQGPCKKCTQKSVKFSDTKKYEFAFPFLSHVLPTPEHPQPPPWDSLKLLVPA